MDTPTKILATLDGEALLDDLETLGQIGRGPSGGVTRLAFSPADQAGRALVRGRMEALGLLVRVDAAGNSVGLLPGRDPSLPPLVLGSHTDTVPDGGRYDGALGVLAAIAVVRTLRESGVQLRHSLEVIDFAGEEATLPGGTFGSRAMAGQLPAATLAQSAWDGRSVAELLTEAGGDPAGLSGVARQSGAITAYLELHIEQGGQLEAMGRAIGIVEGIVGIRRYAATFRGVANHAGTTPMAGRADALVMAAPFVESVRRVAIAHHLVGTVGTMLVEPNAPNVIPGLVRLGLELRGLDEMCLAAAAEELGQLALARGASFEEQSRKAPVRCSPRLMNLVAAAAQSLALPHMTMASGAGHDAMCMAALGPVAMIFVPSIGGVSHAPGEETLPEQCIAGAHVLLNTLLALDGASS